MFTGKTLIDKEEYGNFDRAIQSNLVMDSNKIKFLKSPKLKKILMTVHK
jgi:hypothetical protein